MIKYFVFFLGLTGLLYQAQAQESKKDVYTNISIVDARNLLNKTDSLQVLDVRTSKEISVDGNIGAANEINIDWNKSEFDKELIHLDKSKPILIYCKSGARSAKAANHLIEEGFKTVYNLKGGFLSWKKNKEP